MRKIYLLLPVLMIMLVIQGCFVMPCVHPLYRSDSDIIFDSGLIGVWATKDGDETETWEFSELKKDNIPENSYLVTINQNNEPIGILVGELVEIDGRQFMDLTPYDFEYTPAMASSDSTENVQNKNSDNITGNSFDESGLWFNNALFFPTHTPLQIRRTGDSLWIALTEQSWVSDRVKEGTLEIAYETEGDLVLITASTEDLRAFVSRYADDENVFKFDELKRQ